MRLVLPDPPTRQGRPLAGVVALAVHAAMVVALLGRGPAPASSPLAGHGAPIPLPLLPGTGTGGGAGTRDPVPAPIPLPPPPVRPPTSGPSPIAPPPSPSGNGDVPVAGEIPGRPGAPVGPILWDSISRNEPVAPPRLLDSLVIDYPAGATEGVVDAEYVIDATGRVDSASFVVIGASDPVLTDAVRAALLAARFRPGERGGQAVRALVRQRFRFERH